MIIKSDLKKQLMSQVSAYNLYDKLKCDFAF